MGILGVLLILDIITTNILLIHGGIESNPFMSGIVRNPFLHLLVKSLLLILVFMAAQRCESRLNGSGICLSLLVVDYYSIVVGNNLGVIVFRIH